MGGGPDRTGSTSATSRLGTLIMHVCNTFHPMNFQANPPFLNHIQIDTAVSWKLRCWLAVVGWGRTDAGPPA